MRSAIDMIRRLPRSLRSPESKSGRKDLQKSDFDGEGFLNVTSQMVAQFFQAAMAAENFGCAETTGHTFRFFFCVWQIAFLHASARAQDIRPPKKQNLDELGAPLEVETFCKCFVVIFAFVQPCTVG